jgi:large subunit ribosomal protein L30
MKEIEITLIKSTIDRPEVQKKTVRALGLNKLNSKVVQKDTPQILGMIRKVSHLVKIEYK